MLHETREWFCMNPRRTEPYEAGVLSRRGKLVRSAGSPHERILDQTAEVPIGG